MDKVFQESRKLALLLIDALENNVINCQPCRSLKHGDISVGRLSAEGERIDLSTVYKKYGGDMFSDMKINPQRQLCLSLNRANIFQTCIREIFQSSTTKVVKRTMVMTGPHCCHWQPTVTDGRIILVKSLILNILYSNGHRTEEATLYTKKNDLSFGSQSQMSSSDLVQHFLRSSFPDSHSNTSSFPDSHSITSSFPDSHSSTSSAPAKESETVANNDETFLHGTGSSVYAFYSKPHPPNNLIVDGKRFLKEKSQHVYDDNIAMIRVRSGRKFFVSLYEVRSEDGALSEAALLASVLCQLVLTTVIEEEPSHHVKDMIHICSHADSYKLQQALVLAEIYREACQHNPLSSCQCIVLCSGVEVLQDGVPLKDYSLASLLQIRRAQMTAAYHIKNDVDIQHNPAAESMVTNITEAVVKFELLSIDPQSKIRLSVPGQSDATESDSCFAGSFVLYNYARLANLVNNFEKACKKGTYPPLPDISMVDFSLLNDEEEWYILFHYLLQYPLLIQEIYDSISGSRVKSVRIHTKLKKICQFLSQLSHSVSSYYRRVRILLSPEPHLIPLVHARLLLVIAIKQTMYNALKLLSIEPPQQL